jgi:hypothetical protein
VTRHREATLLGGPLDGGRAFITNNRGGRGKKPLEPAVITLAHGVTDAEPWPHDWLDYYRHPDGTYRYDQPTQEVA